MGYDMEITTRLHLGETRTMVKPDSIYVHGTRYVPEAQTNDVTPPPKPTHYAVGQKVRFTDDGARGHVVAMTTSEQQDSMKFVIVEMDRDRFIQRNTSTMITQQALCRTIFLNQSSAGYTIYDGIHGVEVLS